MEDKQLEKILYDLGKEEIQPPEELIQRTKVAIQNRVLYYLIIASVIMNSLTIIGIIIWSKNYPTVVSLIQWCVLGQLGMSVLVIGGLIATRNKVNLDIANR